MTRDKTQQILLRAPERSEAPTKRCLCGCLGFTLAPMALIESAKLPWLAPPDPCKKWTCACSLVRHLFRFQKVSLSFRFVPKTLWLQNSLADFGQPAHFEVSPHIPQPAEPKARAPAAARSTMTLPGFMSFTSANWRGVRAKRTKETAGVDIKFRSHFFVGENINRFSGLSKGMRFYYLVRKYQSF